MPAAITIQVSRDSVLAQDVSGVRGVLDSFALSLITKNRNSVIVHINGYLNDARELNQILEVRKWFHRLFDSVPELFYWCDMEEGMLLFYATMMFAPVRSQGGSVLRDEDMQKYLLWGFENLNTYCAEHGLDPGPCNEHVTKCLKAL